jgi:hypothetical protein
MPLFDIFVNYGGLCLSILLAVAWITFAQLPAVEGESVAKQWVRALSQTGLKKTAVVLAICSWAWNFGRMFLGDAYLRGSGSFPELSTLLLVVIFVLATVAWIAIDDLRQLPDPGRPQGVGPLHRSRAWHRVWLRWEENLLRLRNFQPWVTHGLVLMLILSTKSLLLNAPVKIPSEESQKDGHSVSFVQKRLASLGCYKAAEVLHREFPEMPLEPEDGKFDSLTKMAVSSFQMANHLLETRPQTRGIIGRDEFSLLSRPFPFLFARPRQCPKPVLLERSSV